MRVIAGSAGGISLDVPKTGVRPTMDQVKGAIFSSLAEQIIGSVVLDLFGGTGSLAIEALSRGAAGAVIVEQDRRAVECIRKNVERTKLTAEVVTSDVYRYLKQAAEQGKQFDLIFADPPYSIDEKKEDHTLPLLQSDYLWRITKPGGVFILEKIPKTPLPSAPAWQLTRQKSYGKTELVFFVKAEA